MAWWFGAQSAVPLLALVDWPGHYRWLYIAVPGLALAVYAGGAHRLSRRGALLVVAGLTLLFGGLTARALPAWTSSGHLFVAMADEYPESEYGHLGVGLEYVHLQMWEDAITALAKAHALGSERDLVFSSWAFALAKLDRCREAQSRFRYYRERPPAPQMEAVQAMAACFERTGDLPAARRAYAFCGAYSPACAARARALGAPRP